ncbi:bifunctional biotin--[acetyl-CoA-carboxylase] ligase/biotin operon repressor BirA [Cognatiluteimonas telluris]|jgi:BirA family biotin operon repressor/biotin-[acetyl-CoA-carboxylase] ligase|uniref:bifunctional biotin--[acetyl-CoA-carboxylase] ligase/biotin operon repressor BirA n=1 Tax=Cognatiluteimonas telluris TaxID=1104775 RepID=UPI00140A933E|nr:bifunctional biotin--[acetyl-CoA-carboxylase] ligase/biotin operon repressor BirA [Lysobacter telluris]
MNDRELLQRLIDGPATGDALARASGQTRAAVWKRIAALREAGIAIAARPGRGYALAQPLELLDAQAIRAQMPAAARKQLACLEVAWSLDSTNTELLRRPAPAEGAVVLLAERQTGGRGRRGRHWLAPMASNLTLSLSRQFAGGLARLPGLSLVAGVATAEALHALGLAQVRLKWPNDLVVADNAHLRKLGGLLVEGGGEHAGPARAVIGLGLNLRLPAEQGAGIDQPWTDLAALAVDMPARNRVAAEILAHWLPSLAQFDSDGLAPFLGRYAVLDALAGREVLVQLATGTQHARALGLAADGALRVEHDGREQRLHAGEVSVRAA